MFWGALFLAVRCSSFLERLENYIVPKIMVGSGRVTAKEIENQIDTVAMWLVASEGHENNK